MAQSPGSGVMHTGLRTFRAGVSTARHDIGTSRVDDGINHKSALKPSFFSPNHFSSSLADNGDPMLKRTRVAVKVLEGKDLLVSDLPTGTSDPVAFVWVGPNEEGEVDLQKDQRVQSTEVKKHTVDPVWDAEFCFPLEVQSMEDVMSGRVNILVRDYDDADGSVHFFDLGRASISLKAVLTEGNIMTHTQLVQLPAQWYPLQRCRGMRKVCGALKIAVGLFFGPDSNLFQDFERETGCDHHPTRRYQAMCFEDNLKRTRGASGINAGQIASLSPSRRTHESDRILTVRGGTVRRRPRSAPGATTLTSPLRDCCRPFALKPLQPIFVRVANVENKNCSVSDPHANAVVLAGGKPLAHETSITVPEMKPRWQDTYGTPERQTRKIFFQSRSGGVDATAGVSPSAKRTGEQECNNEDMPPPIKWAVNDPPLGPVKSSAKLSHLAAKAIGGGARGSQAPLAAKTTCDDEGRPTRRAQQWHLKLLMSIQRLEERSTEAMAYGELRAMVREATATQVAQIVTAVRGVGAGCSISARRYTIRLLSWLCWDQPRAASKLYAGIIAYALDRIGDPESASLRADLAACVGAVMLSALRNSTAHACMVQTQRFLELVREQRATVRESAGICCAAAVLPPVPPVPVEVDTGMRSIDDVRLAIGQAARRVGVSNAVPKESVLLPGGQAVIEMPDASSAAEFCDRVSVASAGLPTTWRLSPFPEEFCKDVKRARVVHAARLAVNSEEILALLLEAVASPRSEGTRAPLLDAQAAMARSCAEHDTEPNESAAWGVEPSEVRGCISATLLKGLPAIVRAILTILESAERRSYTWRERVAALEVVISVAALPVLRGREGPLGEHRSRLIQGSLRGKHDSVAGVRETAMRALSALEATASEENIRKTGGVVASWESSGESLDVRIGKSMTVAETRNSYRALQRGRSKGPRRPSQNKNLDVLVERAVRDEADRHRVSGHQNARASPKRREGWENKRFGLERDDHVLSPEALATISPLSSSSAKGSPQSVTDRDTENQHAEPSPVRNSSKRLSGDGVGVSEQTNRTDRADEMSPSPRRGRTSGEGEVDGSSSERKENRSDRGRRDTPTDDSQGQRTEVQRGAPPLEQAEVQNTAVQAVAVARQSLQPLQPTHATTRPAQVSFPPRLHGSEAPSPSAETGIHSFPRRTDGGVQVDTIWLLSHLNEKSDSIATAVSRLDQRLVGMEESLVERLHRADSPSREPSRKLKRSRCDRVPDTERKPSARPNATPADIARPTPIAAGSAKRKGRFHREVAHCLEHGDFDGAFRLALGSGSERDILRLMGGIRGGPSTCRCLIGIETRDKLFAFVARAISAERYAEHALPWVFEIVKAGEARSLPFAVRMQLAGALHGLAASPTDQGVMAARLGPYLSLTAVGRTSLPDAAEGGDLFRMLVVGGA